MERRSVFQNRIFACAAAVFCTMLWGTAFPFIKLGYEAFAVESGDIGAKLLFAGLRFALAGLMVLLFACVSQRGFALPQKGDWLPIAVLGTVQTFAQYLFTYIGIGFTSGSNTSVITACASFLTVLFAPLFFRADRLTALKIVGCVLGFLGVLAINRDGGSGGTLFGDAMIFGSTVCAAAGNLIAKGIAKGRNPVTLTAWQLLSGGAALSVTGLLCGGRLQFTDGRGSAVLLWLSLVSAVAFTLWTALLKYHPAGRISVFNLLVPVFGTVLSGLLLGENIFRIETAVALALIAAGIILVNLTVQRGEKSS